MTGQMEGDIVFGLHETVALKLVSAMMGGYPIAEMDEMGQSAISELGNMISGNASTILYNQELGSISRHLRLCNTLRQRASMLRRH